MVTSIEFGFYLNWVTEARREMDWRSVVAVCCSCFSYSYMYSYIHEGRGPVWHREGGSCRGRGRSEKDVIVSEEMLCVLVNASC